MKFLLSLLMTILVITVNGQTMSNKDIITEINRELGGDSWSIKGNRIFVKTEEMGNGYWDISNVTYHLKWECWDKFEIDCNRIFVLYVVCDFGDWCISDITDCYSQKVLTIGISPYKRRANNVLELLKSIN
jgi:hypothetical protein